MLPRSAVEHYRTQQRITAVTVTLIRRQWAKMGGDWEASWRRIAPMVLRALVAGQLAAGRQSEPYLTNLMAEYDAPNEPVGRVVSDRLAGVNGEGRPLAAILESAVVTARKAGTLDAGARWLDTVTTTTLADTSRASTAVGMAARPDIGGYTRMLNPPSCSRCVVLAGAVYRWNDGFLRHPGCDCRHIPTVESIPGTPTVDPKAYFGSLDRSMQDKTFGKAGAEAIREGADIGQVVNARRGVYTSADGLKATTTGTSSRSLAGKRLQGAERLMPETIFAQTNSRDEAVELLRRNGFIV